MNNSEQERNRGWQAEGPWRQVVGEIIRKSDRQNPADAVLRSELKRRGGITPAASHSISHAVFAYFRWLGWLDQTDSTEDRIRQALALQERFRTGPGGFPDAELMARAVPAWTSEQVTVSPEWARALQTEPSLWLRARPGQGAELAARLGDCREGAGRLGDALEYSGTDDLFRTPQFHAGEFEVQDLSSQAVGLVCAPQPGQTWWDACAGQGGKLLHLSDLMRNKGLIWASDRAEWRLKVLRKRAARAQVFNYRVASWDGGARLPTKTKFDGVLVDAPCSGLGTWQRNPHARWTTTLQDVEELGAVQIDLLTRVVPSLKPGGKLVYAVCTLTRRETVQVMEAVEARCPELRRCPIENPLQPDCAPENPLWLWPHEYGGNGMFITVWQRAAV